LSGSFAPPFILSIFCQSPEGFRKSPIFPPVAPLIDDDGPRITISVPRATGVPFLFLLPLFPLRLFLLRANASFRPSRPPSQSSRGTSQPYVASPCPRVKLVRSFFSGILPPFWLSGSFTRVPGTSFHFFPYGSFWFNSDFGGTSLLLTRRILFCSIAILVGPANPLSVLNFYLYA